MSEEVLCTGRLSFVAYIGSLIGNAIFIGIVNAIFFGIHWVMIDKGASASVVQYLSWAWIGINVYLVLMAIYRLFYLRSIRWIISDDGVRIVAGILPWAKSDMMHPYETIFEAFYEFGFFAKLFRYGTCHIRRTEGVTTEISQEKMHNAARVSALINEKVRELRKQAKAQPVVSPVVSTTSSATEELARLGQLRADGTITDEEFEQMKRKIIDS